ncbi:ABC transporter ATP-binding protein [Treponema putidum]|uniref:ABC transporter ATP-binding protein n=1 Tax=Treponema putidum TaxID=221027 RepID=A0AAE9SJT8_9SPIR|nr:ABC transporter ATP-binding protein [Treponema putidum]AIN94673.1 ABC transporter ATP-binding protein [Treponema putidum]TWI77537.1 putative ABC transport system ATP-binding protein [Treponema putidum]UTY28689.1 ABC transporter ATP-binding protein [Treponema putidum]UTY31120.1 ABC transporter ATP-binding protein [Treponema putidum]UTY33557.1 ABC transporter ATP-binding protein [Treponema putidum]
MLLKTKSLSKSFARGKNSFFAVKNVDFNIESSDFVFIVGRSGSGKTTFLNLISGILDPTEGQVFFEDKDISSMNDTDKSFYRNESIGFVPQFLTYLPNLSVFDNVRVPFFLFTRDGDSEGRALSLLDLMDIADLKNEMPQNLSGGEIKRMLIARALMNSPKLLIADEPTANLDTETAKQVMSLMYNVNKMGTAVLIVTHDSEILEKKSNIYRMDNGKLKKESA